MSEHSFFGIYFSISAGIGVICQMAAGVWVAVWLAEGLIARLIGHLGLWREFAATLKARRP